MRYVLDASAALTWEIPRPHSAKALRLRHEYRQRLHELIAPDLFMDEVASALTKAERQKLIALSEAAPLYAKIMNDSPMLLSHVSPVPRALDISSQTRTAYYDCLYVALAVLKRNDGDHFSHETARRPGAAPRLPRFRF